MWLGNDPVFETAIGCRNNPIERRNHTLSFTGPTGFVDDF
jgi:hypothetical protein